MFTKQKHAKHAKSTTSAVDFFVPNTAHLACATRPSSPNKQSSSRETLMKISAACSGILLFVLTTLPLAFADSSNATPRWYRYYNSQGIPTLSSTISEQHLQYGYDSLDKDLRLIRHFAPFSGQKYDREQVQREQAIARRISERHLQETYTSAYRATIQRDREVGDIDGQIKRSQQQSVILSASLNESITLAANLERQNKSIPLYLKNQLKTNKDLLNQSQTNVAALKIKREQTSKQFNDAIATLKVIEQRGNRSNTKSTP